MKPVLQALLVADRIYQDKATGKTIVAGVFRSLYFKKREDVQAELIKKGHERVIRGGMVTGSPYAYVSLTDIRGEQEFTLRYVYLNEDRSIFETKIRAKSTDPLAFVDFIVALPNLPTEPAGVYALELIWNDTPAGTPIGSFRIHVQELTFQGEDDDSSRSID